MNSTPENEQELLWLFARVCDGSAAADEVARLSKRLVHDAHLRQLWLQYAHVHGGLGRCLAPGEPLIDWPRVFAGEVAEWTQDEAAVAARAAPWSAIVRFARQYPVISCTIATLVVGLLLGVLGMTYLPERGAQQAGGAQPEFVAELTNVFQPEWADGQIGGSVGAHLQPGHLYELQSGTVEVTYRSGTRLVVEGPATLRVSAANGGALLAGKLTAFVPWSARGFAVETTRGKVVDRGTRFAVEVSPDEQVAVHCFQGKVEYEASRFEPVRLVEGQALLHTSDGQRRLAADPRAFVHELRSLSDLPYNPRGMVAIDSQFVRDVAAGKPATQSSSEGRFGPELAVDGNPANFTSTRSDDAGAWLMVDLQAAHDVELVVLHNRDDCCADRLRDVVVEIIADDGESVVFASQPLNADNRLASPSVLTLSLLDAVGSPVSGRYVRVRRTALPGDPTAWEELANLRVLSLGEMQIFASRVDASATKPVGPARLPRGDDLRNESDLRP